MYGIEKATQCLKCNDVVCYLKKSSHLDTVHRDEIFDLYKHNTIKNIAKQYNCTSEIIRKLLNKYNKIKKIHHEDQNKSIIYDLHVNQHKTVTEISKILRFDCATIKKFMIKNNIPITMYGNSIQRGIQDTIENVKDIYNLYKTKSISEIASMYNCSYEVILNLMQRNNLTRRDFRHSAAIAKRHYMKPYILPSGTSIFIQSKNEQKFLDYIFYYQIFKEDDFDFTHRNKSFKYYINGKKHIYFPDFFIPKYNLFIEIKTEWVLQKQGGVSTQDAKKNSITEQGFKYLLILDNDFIPLTEFMNYSNDNNPIINSKIDHSTNTL
jgi:Mor family transcriptional regulator